MTYEKIKFFDKQLLVAEHLNHMEDGIEAVSLAFSDNKLKETYLPNSVPKNLKTEQWTFTLDDGNTVTKAVYVE